MKYSKEGYVEYLDWKIQGILSLFEENGVENKTATLLDFGCQHGTSVKTLRDAGINACGFDIGEPFQEGPIRKSSLNEYRIPWPDDTFDAIFSHHVFEHVADHSTALKELRRVLKPEGVMIHIFPSRWRLFEAHFFTPFGGVINNEAWCTFWAFNRKPGRRHLSMQEYGKLASNTIRKELNYPSREELFRDFSNYFSIKSILPEYFYYLKGIRIPKFVANLISEFHVRVLLCTKKEY